MAAAVAAPIQSADAPSSVLKNFGKRKKVAKAKPKKSWNASSSANRPVSSASAVSRAGAPPLAVRCDATLPALDDYKQGSSRNMMR
jgi:hypothetical protein